MLLSALLTRGSSDKVVSDYSTLKGLLGAYAAHSRSDNADLDELIPLIRALYDGDPTKVDLVTVPTAPQPDGQGNLVPAAEARPLFDQIRTNQALRGEGQAAPNSSALNAADSAPLPPSQVALTLRNGSAKPKTAVQAADSLRTLGFKIVSLAAAERTKQTVIRAAADQAGQAAALAQAVPSAVVQQVPGTKTLDLVIGDSFDGQIQAAPAGSAAQNRQAPALVTAASVSCQ